MEYIYKEDAIAICMYLNLSSRKLEEGMYKDS